MLTGSRFCIDGHIEQVGLKGLWDMKWHKQYDLTAPLPDWTEWMQQAKD